MMFVVPIPLSAVIIWMLFKAAPGLMDFLLVLALAFYTILLLCVGIVTLLKKIKIILKHLYYLTKAALPFMLPTIAWIYIGTVHPSLMHTNWSILVFFAPWIMFFGWVLIERFMYNPITDAFDGWKASKRLMPTDHSATGSWAKRAD